VRAHSVKGVARANMVGVCVGGAKDSDNHCKDAVSRSA
jgi:hypothetical protein